MGRYEDRARTYGIEVSFFQMLQKLTIAVPASINVDIEFSTSASSVFSLTRRYEVAPRLYISGFRAQEMAEVIRKEERLNALLIFVLDTYAFSVELNGPILQARVNLMHGFPSKDGTDGERLFSSMSEISTRLASLARLFPNLQQPRKHGWGPARTRLFATIGCALLPLLMTVAAFVWMIHRSPGLIHH